MITVAEATEIILQQQRDYGTELLTYDKAVGRTLAEAITADRELPPYDRVTMDGIAISYAAFARGVRVFTVAQVQAAGDVPQALLSENACAEIMTGAALPQGADTVVRYEDVTIAHGRATVADAPIRQGQNIHYKGSDRAAGSIIVPAGRPITPAVISIAATVGKVQLLVRRLPRVVIIATGAEVVAVTAQPTAWQVRSSNSHAIKAALQQQGIDAQLLHLPDDRDLTTAGIAACVGAYDAVITSGGVSMGRYDHVPAALQQAGVQQFFHKVAQRPGKPFWFGAHVGGMLVFAFPGNPVSAFMCLYRYFVPWLQAQAGAVPARQYAVLEKDVNFAPALQYFLQVRTYMATDGRLMALPISGNGSGDLANLTDANAFMELPAGQNTFAGGSVYEIWPF